MKFLYIISTLAAASSINAIPTTRITVFMDDQQIETNSMVCKDIGKSCNPWNEFCCPGSFCLYWGIVAGNCVKNP
ncbi:uncharacterized protein H6S33_002866 [Morchella sextelata]|uniref:uncharacterized protein n=1 Tax=Morchella sextelata TaxID=1174677 RepID=UPI001D05B6A4|nr:uncharacterized protein H6S33_002866 [Morchella sextelata]KAH0607832.1 hypothetical protein H6S33_002866 [Morchella sextelata]